MENRQEQNQQVQKEVIIMSEKQKEYLMKLIKYHKIDFNSNLEEMTKSEASRAIDRIILQYGKL